jgi:D-amino-acid dehydrogenase
MFQPRFAVPHPARFDPTLWSWLTRFVMRCNARDMMESASRIQALLNSCALYDDLLRDEAIDCEWEPRGLLFVFRTPAAMEHHGETVKLLCESFNVCPKRYDADALAALEPALKPGMAGGWLYETDGHLRPDRLMAGLRQVPSKRGVKVLTGCEMCRAGAGR